MSKQYDAYLIIMSEGYPEVKVYKLSPEQRRISAELQRHYRALRKEKQKDQANGVDSAKIQTPIADVPPKESP